MKRALLLYAALALVIAGPGLLPGRRLVPADIPRDLLAWKGDPTVRVRVSNSLLSDVPLQLIPWDIESRRLIANGEMPWMNRYAGTTEHLFANPLAGLLSPFTWPRLLFGLRGWALTVIMKILVAALSAYWLARALGADERAATISGAVYALAGYTIVWALYPQTNVFVVLPALAAAAIQNRRVAITAAAALATAGGHPETLFVGVIAIFAFLVASRKRWTTFWAASLAGFLMIGIQLVPFGIALAYSHAIRARHDQLEIRFRKLTPLAEILPGYLGSPLKGELDLTGPIAFAENFNQRTGGFVGAIAMLAILLAIPRSNRALWVAGGAFVLALAIPGLAHVMKFVPLVNWVAFEYFQVGFVLFAAALAGIALQAVATGRARAALGRTVIVIGLLLAVAGVLPLEGAARKGVVMLQQRGYLHQPSSVYEQRIAAYVNAAQLTAFRRGTLPALCWIAAGVALTMSASRKRETLLATAAVAELVVFAYGYNPAIRVEEIAREPRAIAEIKKSGQWLVASSNDVFPPNLGTTFGVRQSHAYDILTSERETRELAPAGYDPAHWNLSPQPTPEQMAALAARGVRYFISAKGVTELANAVPPPPPRNDPPRGIVIGAIVSALGLALAVFVRYSHSIVLGGFDETS